MARYAITSNTDGEISNVIVWNGTDPWTAPSGTTAVEDTGNAAVIRGWYESGVGFHQPSPKITGIDVTSGSTAGGTAITVTGMNFSTPGATVKFDGTEASSIVVVSDTSITCETPAHAVGQVDVTVENTAGSWTGQNTLTNGFEYTA